MRSFVGSRKILGQVPESGIDEGKQRPESPLVSTVGCGGNQDEVAFLILKKLRKKKEALMGSPPAFDGGGAGVGLVNDHEFRAGPQEVKTAAVRFDKVRGDHHKGMSIEDRLVPPQISLKSSGGTGKDQLGMDVEFGNELLLPLFRQVRRAENANTIDLPPIQKLAGHETGLDALSYAHIVGDEEADRVQFQGHEERHKLVGPGLAGEPPKGPERTGAGAKPETDRIPQEATGYMAPQVLRSRRLEASRLDLFKSGMDPGGLLKGAAQGPDDEEVAFRFGKDHPFPSPGADKRSRCKGHFTSPNIEGCFLTTSSQLSLW